MGSSQERIEALEKELKELKSVTKVTDVTENVCLHCGEKFETSRKHTQYCSPGCKQEA
jgi:predicted Zn-ribbon and HTH transcriptional regulator